LLRKKKRGKVIIISSPSGAGKTTIVKSIASSKPNTELSVSLTTREPRGGELNGVDYHFVSKLHFKKIIKKKLFLEHANVFNNYYGTLKSSVLKKIKKGKNVLLDIDWQGARQVKKKLLDDVISIFILPPSLKELESRLKKREKNKLFIKKRMSKAKREIIHWKEYDYSIVNDKLSECIKKINYIIDLDDHRPHRQSIFIFK